MSQDTLEVMCVSHYCVSIDLSDMTLVSEDTYGNEDDEYEEDVEDLEDEECEEDEEDGEDEEDEEDEENE